jgi:hypothetical protein
MAQKPPKRKAEECPWYLLATLYGVPESRGDPVREKNRIVWNRFMAARLSKKDRAALIQSGRCREEDLTAFTPVEISAIEEAFAARRQPSISVQFPQWKGDQPQPRSRDRMGSPQAKIPVPRAARNVIDFSDLEFDQRFYVDGFLFAEGVRFSHTVFLSYASFDGAIFSGRARFLTCTFSKGASFENTSFSLVASFDGVTFSRSTSFGGAIFSRNVSFRRGIFKDRAKFDNATFSGSVTFEGVIFSGVSTFEDAIFSGRVAFTNSEMNSPTSFQGVTFKEWPPSFFGAKLHEGTIWHRVIWPPPPEARRGAYFVSAYERLKLEMDRLKKHWDELDFFALEMQSRRKMSRLPKGLPIALYGLLCDYGRSYVRPLCGLLVTVIAGALLSYHHGLDDPRKAIGVSLANTFGLLGFRRDLLSAETIHGLSDLLTCIAGLQTVVGAMLLFLFGLALRNRLRMR